MGKSLILYLCPSSTYLMVWVAVNWEKAYVWIGRLAQLVCFAFFSGSLDTIHVPPNSAKHSFLDKFESRSIIYTFKNYFIIIFLAITFSFSTNKQYSNTLKVDKTNIPIRWKKRGSLSIFFYSIYLISFSLLAKRYAYLFASRYVLHLNLPLFLHEPPVIKDNKHIHIYQQRNILSCYK